MLALFEFVTRLVGDVGRFVDVFVNDLILGAADPLSAVLVIIGQTLVIAAISVFGYAAVGGLLSELGVELPSLGDRGRRE